MSDTSSKPKRTPVWQSISNEIRSDIAEGRYGEGDKLPTEARLAARFGVNRHTVRHALAKLSEEGVLRSRRGAGSFVCLKSMDYQIGKRVRFHENLRRIGQEPAKKVLSLESRKASEGEAKALDMSLGDPVLAYTGLSLGDGVPVALAEAVFPLARMPGLDQAMRESQGITMALQKIGVTDYTRKSTRVTAVLASATQALHLQVSEGAPLIRTSSLSVDPAGMPVELGRTWFAGDRVTLTLEE